MKYTITRVWAEFSPHQRWVLTRSIAVGAVVSVGLAYLSVADPHDPGVVMPLCPTKAITHLDCPACGGLRMVYSLIHGDWRRALHDNALLMVGLPFAVAFFGYWAWTSWQGRPWKMPRWLGITTVVIAAVWGIVRNLPGWPYPPT